MSDIRVSLSKPNYFPGEIVDAQVELNVTKELILRQFTVEFSGKNRTYATGTVYFSPAMTMRHLKTTPLVNIKKILLEKESLPPGSYIYDVKFKLPSDVLPTFHSKNLDINYMIQAIAKIKRRMNVKRRIEVKVDYSFSNERSSRPIVLTSKHYGDNKKKPGMQVQIINDYFKRGEKIPITLKITPGLNNRILGAIFIKLKGDLFTRVRGWEDCEKILNFESEIPLDSSLNESELEFVLTVPSDIKPSIHTKNIKLLYYLEYYLYLIGSGGCRLTIASKGGWIT